MVFLLNDNNITEETMLADINGLLNTGEVTGVWRAWLAPCTARVQQPGTWLQGAQSACAPVFKS